MGRILWTGIPDEGARGSYCGTGRRFALVNKAVAILPVIIVAWIAAETR